MEGRERESEKGRRGGSKERILPHALLPEDGADEHPVSNANEG